MAAKEKASSQWSAWLAPILFLLAAVAAAGPASALTCGTLETRAWEKTPAPLESRLDESLQLLNLHQQNGGAGYDSALGSPLAAKGAADTAPGTDVGQPGEIARRFDSKSAVKAAKKAGIEFDPAKGEGIPATTTDIDPVNPDKIRQMTGARNADHYIDIDIGGKKVLRLSTKQGHIEIRIQESVKPDNIVNSGRTQKSGYNRDN